VPRFTRILEPQVIAQLDCAGVAYRSSVRLAAGGGWIRNVSASHQHSAAASAYPSALRQFHKQGSRMTSRGSALTEMPSGFSDLLDSPLEGTRFEPSVPRDATNISKAASWRLFLIPRDGKVGAIEIPRPAERRLPQYQTFESISLHRGACEPHGSPKPVMPSTQQAKPSIWGRTSACECISSRTLRRFPRGYSQTRIIDSLVEIK
jgi:hypothetical protein